MIIHYKVKNTHRSIEYTRDPHLGIKTIKKIYENYYLGVRIAEIYVSVRGESFNQEGTCRISKMLAIFCFFNEVLVLYKFTL